MPYKAIEDDSDQATFPLVPSRDYTDGKVYAFTDGALSHCRITGIRFGGWGIFMQYRQHIKRLAGAKANTTTQEMELEAVWQAVSALGTKEHKLPVRVYCDNKWVVDSIIRAKGGYDFDKEHWQPKSWVVSDGKNQNLRILVQNIVEKSAYMDIVFYWIKGHSDILGNVEADKLAVSARQAFRDAYLNDSGGQQRQWKHDKRGG